MKNLFIEHLKCELRYNGIYRKNLFESQGVVPNNDIYVERIVNYCKEFTGGKVGEYEIVLPNDLFGDISDRFFDESSIKIKLMLLDGFTKNYESDGGYNGGFSSYSKMLDRIRTLKMDFEISCSKDYIRGALSPIISHEFIHAYQDYNMLRSNKRGLLSKYVGDNYFNNLYNGNNVEDELKKDLSTIIYYIYQPEVNAYAGAIRSYVEEYGENGDYNELFNNVQKCHIFTIYEDLEEKAKRISDISDIEVQKDLLGYWNENVGKYKKGSFKDMLSFINRRLLKIESKISSVACKQIADYYYRKRIERGFGKFGKF